MPDCLAPNGTTQYLSRAADSLLILGGGSFAVAARVYLTADATQVFVAKASAISVRELFLEYSATAKRFRASVGDSAGTLYTAVADTFGLPALNAWYWLVLVYDHTNALVKIYVNTIKDQASVSSPVVNTAAPLTLAARMNSGTPGLFSSARIADLWIFQGPQAVPTDAEVAAVYNGGSRLRWHEIGQVAPSWSRGLRAPWTLDELAGDRIDNIGGLILSPVNAPGVAAAQDFANADNRQPITVASGTYAAGALAGQATAEGDLWAQHDTETQAFTVGSDGLAYRGGTAAGLAYLDRFVPSNETPIRFRLVKKSALTQTPGIVYRMRSKSGTINGYTFRYNNGSGWWEFGKIVAGTFTSLGNWSAALTDGETYDVIVRPNSLFHEFWIRGPGDSDHRHLASVYDDTLSLQASGYVALRVLGSGTSTSTTGYHIALDSVQRGTWAITDVARLSTAGGSDSTHGGLHVAVPVADDSRLHVLYDARYGGYEDGRPMDLIKVSAPLADLAGEWPIAWDAPVTLADAGGTTVGVGHRNSDPCYWVLPNGDHLCAYAEYPPGYSAVGNDPAGATAATTGGSGSSTTTQVKLKRSTDGGQTWSSPVTITDQVKDTALWSAMYPGQQQAVVLPSGRIVAAFGHKVYSASENGGELVYTDDFAGQPSGSPDLAEVVFERGGDLGKTAGEHSMVLDGESLVVLPRDYPADSTTWRYGTAASSGEEAIGPLTEIGLFNPAVRTGIGFDGTNYLYAHVATPQSGGRQTVRLYAGPSLDELAPVGGGTDFPGLGIAERGGAQYPNVVAVEIDGVWHVVLTWGRGGRPAFGTDFTNIMGSIGIGGASYTSLGLTEPSAAGTYRRPRWFPGLFSARGY